MPNADKAQQLPLRDVKTEANLVVKLHGNPSPSPAGFDFDPFVRGQLELDRSAFDRAFGQHLSLKIQLSSRRDRAEALQADVGLAALSFQQPDAETHVRAGLEQRLPVRGRHVPGVEVEQPAGGDWRLPTREELQGLYQPDAGDRNMPPAFKTTGWLVWAEPRDAASAWAFNFKSGTEYWYYRDSSDGNRVFGVRAKPKQ